MNTENIQATALTADDKTLTAACKRLLQQQSFATQNDLRLRLIELGYEGISQSTVSRLLSQLGVVKVQNACGKKVYCMTVESAPVRVGSSISSQIEFITHNQLMVVIKTHPGSAQLVARLIDIDPHGEILGTVGGNDTVIVAPKDVSNIEACERVVKERLGVL
ncbi:MULTISPECIES: arginine repressor [Vibrio]|uniref:Arginine repressor n=2 Tax=Vibrio TaxID=662 RepID=A0A1E5D6Y8_9VIBR|nr:MULTISPECIES: arginine repressor [Vibrio]NOH85085.1 arginine repressor [Vibrio sp. 03-59-1]RBW67072.1 arginine repressor [Vibrionales bacterium C3R12]MDN3696418.1 arginine repressor [Vibrio cortegadensis]OEE79387.1 arginine repressor [Vibrio genomosp. F6 str. FF-238]TKF21278.1 arginine repressor [Vibrio genomosp. F6]